MAIKRENSGYVGARPKDPSGLSKKPSQIRNRLRRAKARGDKTGDYTDYHYEYNLLRNTTDFKPVEEWDLEELAHGRPRNRIGRYGGKLPDWLSAEVTRESKKRLFNKAYGKLASNVVKAVEVLENLMMSEDVDEKGRPIVDARTRLAAAQFIIEHVVGKPEKALMVDGVDAARQMFAAAIVLDDGKPQGHLAPKVIEGTVIPSADRALGAAPADDEDLEAGD